MEVVHFCGWLDQGCYHLCICLRLGGGIDHGKLVGGGSEWLGCLRESHYVC